MNHGIDVEATVTIDSGCAISCEVLGDQLQFIFGGVDTGLRLYLDWPTLDRLVKVASAATTHARRAARGKLRFMVSADADSRDEHKPNYAHGGDQELLVSDVDDQAGRQPMI